MKIFKEPNLSNPTWRCPICGTRNVEPVTLIPKYGTEKDGNVEAEQVHVSCLQLVLYENESVIAMKYCGGL